MRAVGRQYGFTLIEVVAASVIATFIAVVAVSTLRVVAEGREDIEAATEISDEMRYAMGKLRRDFGNLYRSSNIDSMKFVGEQLETEQGLSPSVTMWVVSNVPARYGDPEGDIYEVQYYLESNEEGGKLMRRVCPTVGIDRSSEYYVEAAGGILSVIAENVVDFQLLYHDGYEFVDQWPEEQEYLPEFVEVTLVGQSPDDLEGRNQIARNFIETFPRVSENLRDQVEEDMEGGTEGGGQPGGGPSGG